MALRCSKGYASFCYNNNDNKWGNMKRIEYREIIDTWRLVQNKMHENQGEVSLWGQSNQWLYLSFNQHDNKHKREGAIQWYHW